jgi:hypothetical protein
VYLLDGVLECEGGKACGLTGVQKQGAGLMGMRSHGREFCNQGKRKARSETLF